MSKERAPILVTGSHRSGSTWVRKMLSCSPGLGYIHEPFNPKISVLRNHFNYWYTYICKENESIFKNQLNDCLKFKYHILEETKGVESVKDIARIVRDYSNFLCFKLQDKRPLGKDPISLFSAGWLHDTFNMNVIVLIRHPAAFVGS